MGTDLVRRIATIGTAAAAGALGVAAGAQVVRSVWSRQDEPHLDPATVGLGLGGLALAGSSIALLRRAPSAAVPRALLQVAGGGALGVSGAIIAGTLLNTAALHRSPTGSQGVTGRGTIDDPVQVGAAADAVEGVRRIAGGTGPILIAVPGTGSGRLEGSLRPIAEQLAERGDAPSVVTVGYPSTVAEGAQRFFGAVRSGEDTLDATLRAARAQAGERPVYLVAESQGSWIVAEAAHRRKGLIERADRALLFSAPGFAGVDDALPADATRYRAFEHDDDIVPATVWGVRARHLGAIPKMLSGGEHPHDYARHARDAAAFLDQGRWRLDD